MSKHSPRKIVVHRRRIVYLNKGHGSKHPRVSASKIHIHRRAVAIVIYVYSLARAGFCHWKGFWWNSGSLRWTRRTTVRYVPSSAERSFLCNGVTSSCKMEGKLLSGYVRLGEYVPDHGGRSHARKSARASIPMILQSAMLSYLGRDITCVCWPLIAVISRGNPNNGVYSQYITHWSWNE